MAPCHGTEFRQTEIGSESGGIGAEIGAFSLGDAQSSGGAGSQKRAREIHSVSQGGMKAGGTDIEVLADTLDSRMQLVTCGLDIWAVKGVQEGNFDGLRACTFYQFFCSAQQSGWFIGDQVVGQKLLVFKVKLMYEQDGVMLSLCIFAVSASVSALFHPSFQALSLSQNLALVPGSVLTCIGTYCY